MPINYSKNTSSDHRLALPTTGQTKQKQKPFSKKDPFLEPRELIEYARQEGFEICPPEEMEQASKTLRGLDVATMLRKQHYRILILPDVRTRFVMHFAVATPTRIYTGETKRLRDPEGNEANYAQYKDEDVFNYTMRCSPDALGSPSFLDDLLKFIK